MPTVETIDFADRLEGMAAQLYKAPAPQPLGAYDGYDLRCAAAEIRRGRVEADHLRAEVAELKDRIARLEAPIS